MIVRNKTLMTAISSVSPICCRLSSVTLKLSENICSNFDLKLVFRSKTSIAAMT